MNADAAEASIVIFGASGDLTARKLLPALYCLAQDGFLSDRTPIIGVARREKSDEEFRAEMFKAVSQHSRRPVTDETWKKFSERLFYRVLDLSNAEAYPGFAQELGQIEQKAGVSDKRLFYMATTPELFVPTAEAIAKAGMVPDRRSKSVLRMIFEKPFGTDLASAQELTRKLARLLREDQIWRIDHYLGKETVQNILLFRFGNAIFEPLFNRTHVDHVQITVSESLGMESGRGGYYDKSGALRDVVQNHMLQLLALVAMEPPAFFKARDIHHEKLKILESMRGAEHDVKRWAVRGQYSAGKIGKEDVPAYRKEDRIPPDSNCETYAALDVRIDNWRWGGVPFYLRHGKRLPKRVSEIAVQFKLPPTNLFKTVECEGDICELVEARPNKLVFRIQPSEAISISFGTKRPGMQYQIHPVQMDFAYQDAFTTSLPEAYERLLLDALRGDSTLFMQSDELEACWRLVTPVLEAWEADPAGPELYEAGTWGPEGANKLLNQEGRRWHNP